MVTTITTQMVLSETRNYELFFYPDWTLQIYVPNPSSSSPKYIVPQTYIELLLNLGVQIVYVNVSALQVSLEHMNLLVALDLNVKRFLIRNPDHRFSQRERDLVKDWEKTDHLFHAIRDHVVQDPNSVVSGLYGAIRHLFVKSLGVNILALLSAVNHNDLHFLEKHDFLISGSLEDIIWDRVSSESLYHDSLMCELNEHVYFKPRESVAENFIGEKFDGFGEVSDLILHSVLTYFC